MTNEHFRAQLKSVFDQKYLRVSSEELISPLYQLIELDKRANRQSILVHDLIQLKKEHLVQDAFYQPTEKTVTYLILFDRSLVDQSIRVKLMPQLHPMWRGWEEDGFHLSEIDRWNELREKQRAIVSQIWNLIGEDLGRSVRFEQLINETERRINESVTRYLNHYCQNAHDRSDYFTDIVDIRFGLKRGKVNLIKIPQSTEEIEPHLHPLNSICEWSIWQTFRHQQNIRIEVNPEQITCLRILKESEFILQLFIEHINTLWND